MKIGTPLSKTALKVMLLGSGELGKEVIIALQRLGVETIAVDRYPNAPGQQVAHRSYVINMTDPDELRALIQAEQPDLVVPEIEAIATALLAEIEQEGLCKIIPNARAAQLTMNREGIRKLAAETLELPTSRYGFADSLNQLQMIIDQGVGYPCIIKPVMSSSGKGQKLVERPEEVEAAWDCAMQAGRVQLGKVIAEEKIEFDIEITLLTVRATSPSGEIKTYFCEPIGHRQVNGDYVESWQPQELSTKALQSCQHIARQVTSNLGGTGIFGVELFIKGEQVWFSEVSTRPHDTGMVTMITQSQNEFELHARAILGLPVDTGLIRPGASAVIYGGLEASGITFSGIEKALAVANSDLRLFGKPESFNKRRMGVALAYGNSAEDSLTRAKQMVSMIETQTT